MPKRVSGASRLCKTAIAGTTLPLIAIGSAATAAPAYAETPRTSLAPKTASPANISAAQKALSSPNLASPVAIPAHVASAKVVTKRTAKTYRVKSGDTLSHIALTQKVSLKNLLKWNSLRATDTIFPGDVIKLSAQASSSASKGSANTGTGSQAYTVKRGDTLSGIAARNGITLSALLSANGISATTVIYPGQSLKLSGGASSSSSRSSGSVSTASSSGGQQLVTNNFPGYTYSDQTVSNANQSKQRLLNGSVPSRAQIQSMVRSTAQSMGVDPSLALAHAMTESGFDATAVSPANAIGTMQVIPSSGEWASQMVGRKLNLYDPQDNITAGVAIIRHLQRNGDLETGIAGYYQGEGGVRKYGMKPDTKQYVSKVKGYMSRF